MLDHIVVQVAEVNLEKNYSFLIFYTDYLVQRKRNEYFLLAWKTIFFFFFSKIVITKINCIDTFNLKSKSMTTGPALEQDTRHK